MVRVAVLNELHMDVFGDGVPALFVHGSFGWGLETFPDQRAMADQYQVFLIDRRGFGESRSLEAEGWPVDMHDVAALLDDAGPAHMVGQSYGAVVVLLAQRAFDRTVSGRSWRSSRRRLRSREAMPTRTLRLLL